MQTTCDHCFRSVPKRLCRPIVLAGHMYINICQCCILDLRNQTQKRSKSALFDNTNAHQLWAECVAYYKETGQVAS